MDLFLEIVELVEVDEDDLEVLNIIQFGAPRLYDRENHFHTMDASTFRKRFRLSDTVDTVQQILIQIEDQLEYRYDLNNCVSLINQLLATLRLYSTGGHLDSVADFAGMHLSTLSRIIVRVSEAIASLSQNYISMPTDIDCMRVTQQNFYDLKISNFPRVLGAVDGTHCRIISPGGDDPEIFRNRKGYFSINAQFVCDSRLKILDGVTRWPGSTHDSTIFNNSRLRIDFENNQYRNCLLLGDNGYANKTYLLTPLLHPVTEAERRYNESHIRTRNVIERLFGVLKRRFPILSYGCRLKVETFLTIIVCTSVLHNIALNMGDEEAPPLPHELDNHALNLLIQNGQIPDVNEEGGEDVAATTRLALINDYFDNFNRNQNI